MSTHVLSADSRTTIKNLIDLAPDGFAVKIEQKKRNLNQNAKLWACLQEISEQVMWYGQRLSPEDWKNMMTASLKKTRAVPGIDGGVVVLGISTRDMNKEEFSELIELAQAFGADHDVRWSA